MNGNLQMIWNEVSNTFIKEQRPYIMSYSIFMSYFIHKKNKQILPMDFFKEKALINLADPEDYEVKEAFFILEKAMDRAYMLEFPVARKLSEELPQKLEQLKISTIEDVNQCIDELQYLLTYENGFSFMPESLLKLITQFALLEKAESVANFCCGFSYTGLSVWNALKKNWGTEPRFQAVDYNRFYCAISRILAWINEVPECQIKNRDILEPEIGNISKADLIIADIPKGMNDIYCLFGCEKRFLGYKKKSVYTDWVFIVDVLEHLKENGRAFVIVTKGALVRRNEKALRKMYVECDWLEAVITLPPNMYANTNMAMELVIFRRKAKKTHQTFLRI